MKPRVSIAKMMLVVAGVAVYAAGVRAIFSVNDEPSAYGFTALATLCGLSLLCGVYLACRQKTRTFGIGFLACDLAVCLSVVWEVVSLSPTPFSGFWDSYARTAYSILGNEIVTWFHANHTTNWWVLEVVLFTLPPIVVGICGGLLALVIAWLKRRVSGSTSVRCFTA